MAIAFYVMSAYKPLRLGDSILPLSRSQDSKVRWTKVRKYVNKTGIIQAMYEYCQDDMKTIVVSILFS